METIEIGGILHRTDLAEISLTSIPDRPAVAGTILKALGNRHISVRFIVQCIDAEKRAHIVLCVAQRDLESALSIVQGVHSELGGGDLTHQLRVGMVSIFGPEFQERPGLAGVMFSALASADIDIRAISTSIATVTCLIDIDRLEEAIDALHGVFTISDQWQI
jgi:aspartate kinase